jgi:hypothetical protein
LQKRAQVIAGHRLAFKKGFGPDNQIAGIADKISIAFLVNHLREVVGRCADHRGQMVELERAVCERFFGFHHADELFVKCIGFRFGQSGAFVFP